MRLNDGAIKQVIQAWILIGIECEKLNNWLSLSIIVHTLHKTLTRTDLIPIWEKMEDGQLSWVITARSQVSQPIEQLKNKFASLNPPALPLLSIFFNLGSRRLFHSEGRINVINMVDVGGIVHLLDK